MSLGEYHARQRANAAENELRALREKVGRNKKTRSAKEFWEGVEKASKAVPKWVIKLASAPKQGGKE